MRYKFFWLLLGLLCLVAVQAVFVPCAYACSCAPPRSLKEAKSTSDAVFVGRVLDIDIERHLEQFGFDRIRVTFEVSTIWKGISQSQVIIHEDMCPFPFKVGRDYVVFAETISKNHLSATACSSTAEIVGENEQLRSWDGRMVGQLGRVKYSPVSKFHAVSQEDFATLGEGYAPTEQVDLVTAITFNRYWLPFLVLLVIAIALGAFLQYRSRRRTRNEWW
jgi:hypothetical protein